MKQIIIIMALLLTACDSYDIERQKIDDYCENVRTGAWVAYDDKIDCGVNDDSSGLH